MGAACKQAKEEAAKRSQHLAVNTTALQSEFQKAEDQTSFNAKTYFRRIGKHINRGSVFSKMATRMNNMAAKINDKMQNSGVKFCMGSLAATKTMIYNMSEPLQGWKRDLCRGPVEVIIVKRALQPVLDSVPSLSGQSVCEKSQPIVAGTKKALAKFRKY